MWQRFSFEIAQDIISSIAFSFSSCWVQFFWILVILKIIVMNDRDWGTIVRDVSLLEISWNILFHFWKHEHKIELGSKTHQVVNFIQELFEKDVFKNEPTTIQEWLSKLTKWWNDFQTHHMVKYTMKLTTVWK